MLPSVFAFGLVLFSWLFLRPILSKYPALKVNETAAIRLQNQPDFINLQLSQLAGTDMGDFPFELIVGSASAPVTLSM